MVLLFLLLLGQELLVGALVHLLITIDRPFDVVHLLLAPLVLFLVLGGRPLLLQYPILLMLELQDLQEVLESFFEGPLLKFN